MTHDLDALLKAQRSAFHLAPRRSLKDRRADLRRVEDMVTDHAQAWCRAVSADFGHRAQIETEILELSVVARSARAMRGELGQWMRPRPVATPMLASPGSSSIRSEPKGVVGIVSPWNYPIQLALMPLLAALAAGCRVMIKPSELTPNTNRLMADLIAKAFPADQVSIIEGGPEVAEAFSALPFDHLMFTGSTRIGRKVATLAAQNMTPLTLELGGKSPVFVDPAYPLQDVVHPVAWGRFLNAGQTCVAPDYVLAIGGSARAQSIAQALIQQAEAFYPAPHENPDYSSIIADHHYRRLEALVAEARAAGATVLQAAHDPAMAKAARKFPPTVILDPPAHLAVMREEIFGPILPVLSMDGVETALAHVRSGGHPLALYVFSQKTAWVSHVLDHSQSGGVTVNGTMLHLANDNLPFGGVGESGYGAYRGRRGFEEFSHARSVFKTGKWHSTRLAAPPYGKLARKIADMALKL